MIEFLLQLEHGTFRFHARHITLGRDTGCSFVLPDPSVMPVHASLSAEHERLFLEKAELDALTFLNRAPIHERAEVFDGDLIDIGPWTIVLRSLELARREGPAPIRRHEVGVTPSDMTIVRTVRLDHRIHGPFSQRDDTSSSGFII